MAFRKKLYKDIQELKNDLDDWLDYYNNKRTHTGKYCFGKTPMQTFFDSLKIAKEKILDNHIETSPQNSQQQTINGDFSKFNNVTNFNLDKFQNNNNFVSKK